MAMSDYTTEDSLKYHLTAGAVGTRPTAWELSLHTGDPGTDGTANEVADSGYARQTIAFTVTGPAAENSALVTFPAAVEGFTATHLVVWGDSDPRIIQALKTPKVIAIGNSATLAAGELTVGGSA